MLFLFAPRDWFVQAQPDGVYEPDFTQFDQDFFGVSSFGTMSQPITGGQVRRKLLSILDSVSLCQTYPEAIQLEFFDPGAIDRLIITCEQKAPEGSFCNVKVLHKQLMTELNNIQGATAGIGQRQHIIGVSSCSHFQMLRQRLLSVT